MEPSLTTWKRKQYEMFERFNEVWMLDAAVVHSSRAAVIQVQRAIADTIFKACIGELNPSQAADVLSEAVLSSHRMDDSFNMMFGAIGAAARDVSDQQNLQRLAALAVEMSHLPDALNTSSSPMTFTDGVTDFVVQPGQQIELMYGDKLWSRIVSFPRDLWGDVAGPERYLPFSYFSDSDEDRLTGEADAEQHFTNVSTFCAFAIHENQSRNDDDDGGAANWTATCFEAAFMALPRALEFPEVPYRAVRTCAPISSRIRGAAVYVLTARRELLQKIERGVKTLPGVTGGLWTELGGSHEITLERWRFWRRRFLELGENTKLPDKIASAARAAAVMIHDD